MSPDRARPAEPAAGHPHRPGPRRGTPTSTYRLQLGPGFGFGDVAAIAGYLDSLGISHVYLSPILQAVDGSTHGYDVTNHTTLNAELGGRPGFDEMVTALHERGMRVIADIVPNHMMLPTPLHLNVALWSVLRDGPGSAYARWFDIDWAGPDERVLLPVLGAPPEDVVEQGDIVVTSGGPTGDEPVLRYFEQEFPLRTGTAELPLPELLDAQHYQLAGWRDADALNFRRFFDVTNLVAIRVEEPEVFAATHALILELVGSGALDGLRIDHPDGLADPRGYLARLAERTDDAWVVAEKILEGHEALPDDMRCSGTTGYDALLRVGGLFVDPAGRDGLDAACREITGDSPDIADVVRQAKTVVVETVLPAEVNRLLGLVERAIPGADIDAHRRALSELLIGMDRYRAYVDPGVPADDTASAVLEAAYERAAERLDDADHAALRTLVELAAGRLSVTTDRAAADDFVVRFQQTCGPVMAKGVEDTAFYRHVRLVALNEVGGNPGIVGVGADEFHEYCRSRLADWPVTMTTLTTHDTKRTEDTRAMLAVLSELPEEWLAWVRTARELAADYRRDPLDAATEYLLWQTLVATWPISEERLAGYATKAVKEAKAHTTWIDADEDYEAAVAELVAGITADEAIAAHARQWQQRTAAAYRAAVLGQKLVQLTMPGVPDVYQGRELTDRSLVDPDNRRPVDFASLTARLARLDGGSPPTGLDDEKLLVTSRALRLRRDNPAWFVGDDAGYWPLAAGDHAVAFARGDDEPRVVVVAARHVERVRAAGGWGAMTVDVPAGRWRDLLSDREVDGGPVRIAELLADRPVTLLVAV